LAVSCALAAGGAGGGAGFAAGSCRTAAAVATLIPRSTVAAVTSQPDRLTEERAVPIMRHSG
jgi:hypothetical protein